MKCLNCGSEIGSGENFCGNCGAKVIRDGETEKQETQKYAFFCENCKAEVSLDDEFCGNCGQKIDHGRIKDSGESAGAFPKPAVQETHAQNAGAAYDAKCQLKTKSFWKYLLLGLVTFGIYAIYVMWHVTKDINDVCKEDDRPSPNYIVVALLSGITFGIYGMYWYYRQGRRLYEVSPRYDAEIKENGMTYLLWILFLPGIGELVAAYLLFKNLNRCISKYNGNHVTDKPLLPQRAGTGQKVLFGIAIAVRVLVVIFWIAVFIAFGVWAGTPEEETASIEDTAAQETVEDVYLLPESNSRNLTESDLNGFTEWECRLALNEIYARHGRMFDNEDIQAYFNGCGWYEPIYSPDEFPESELNGYEKANIDFIANYEVKMGYREEQAYEIGSIEELYDSDKYLNKTVIVSGYVSYSDGIDGPLKMYGEYSDAEVLLMGTTGYDLPVEEYLNVKGSVSKDKYGGVIIYVEDYAEGFE